MLPAEAALPEPHFTSRSLWASITGSFGGLGLGQRGQLAVFSLKFKFGSWQFKFKFGSWQFALFSLCRCAYNFLYFLAAG